MKIGIHDTNGSFSERWIAYCVTKGIDFKLINCYRSDIIDQLSDCDAFMWHFHQNSVKAVLFAKELLYSVEASGKKVFPDFHTIWHFDDKVGQKYLLEAIGAPLVPTWVFYDEADALRWAAQCEFPKVFKLRGGGGAQNVRLVGTKRHAYRLIHKAFKGGFPQYDPLGRLKERWRLFQNRETSFKDILKGVARLIIPPKYARMRGNEKGYIYFQDFIPGNDHDIRTIVIGNKAFAIKRMVRKNDFRASGSGNILYDRFYFDERIIKLSFDIAGKLQTQCVAFDFIYDNSIPLLVEISYGFTQEGYDECPGYWDENLIWHEGKFDPCIWMVELVL